MNFKSQLKMFLEMLFYPKLKDSFRIKSHLTYSERVELYKLAKGKKVVVEIGSYIGASAAALAPAILPTGKLYCIDTWNNDAMTEGLKGTKDDFKLNVEKYLNKIVMLQGYSDAMHIELEHLITEPVDLLFIDGDHSYQGALSDWLNYKKFLNPGSIVVFHDYGWADGVITVVHEKVIHEVSAWGCLPNLWWGIIK